MSRLIAIISLSEIPDRRYSELFDSIAREQGTEGEITLDVTPIAALWAEAERKFWGAHHEWACAMSYLRTLRLIPRISTPVESLQGADLSKAYLRDADLRGAFLRSADLRDAVLHDADLSGADLGWADLTGTDLRWVDLRSATLHSATFGQGEVRVTDLRGADLRGAAFCSANLRNADLDGADLSEASLYDDAQVGVVTDRDTALPAKKS